MNESTTYLGDSVYLDTLPYGYEIYTNNGMGRDNVIFLEPEVIVAFVKIVTNQNTKANVPT